MTTYYRYGDTVQDDQGRPIPGAIITASTYPSGTATIYADVDGTTPVTGVVTDANGYFEFFAAQGRYVVLITANSIGTLTRSPVDLGNTAAGVMVASGTNHAAGLAPDPGSLAGTTKFLREDATWQVPAYATTFVASGASHAAGLVPDPGASSGTTKFLREDATWATVAATVTTDWTVLTNFSNGWAATDTSTNGTFAAKIDANGIVWIRGAIARGTGTSGSNELMLTLPTEFHPAYLLEKSVPTSSGTGTLIIKANGQVNIVDSGVSIVFPVVSFPSAAVG